jgi:hypothetical protein
VISPDYNEEAHALVLKAIDELELAERWLAFSENQSALEELEKINSKIEDAIKKVKWEAK